MARAAFDEVIEYLSATLVGWLGRRIRPDENFFDAGLNSVMLARLQDSIRERFELSLPPATLFTYPNLRALAGFLDAGPGPPPEVAAAGRPVGTGQARRDIRARIRRAGRSG